MNEKMLGSGLYLENFFFLGGGGSMFLSGR